MSQIPPVQYPPPTPTAPQADGLAIASLVCGIVGLLGACGYGFGLLPAIAGVICGHKSKTPGGIRTAGLICSWIGLGLSLIVLAWVIFAIILVVGGAAAGGMAPRP